jgi:short-subunit dehydrogenase
VSENRYFGLINDVVPKDPIELGIYFVGIGELFDPLDMSIEVKIIGINLTGMVKTASAVIPKIVERGKGHFIGVSSFAGL